MLCYHGVVPEGLPPEHPQHPLTVSVSDFAEQLEFIRCWFRPVTAGEVREFYVHGAPLPRHSLLVTFGITVIIESCIQWIWTADYRRLESHYAEVKFRLGALYVPLPELLTLIAALVLCGAVWAVLRLTDLGKALRAAAEDAPIAAAFGVDERRLSMLLSGAAAAFAGVAGVCLALSFTLSPSQIYAWIGVVFAAVMIGGLGSPLGPLAAGILIGVSEAVTMAFTAPAWAPLVSFSLLILVLLLRPGKV